jgi:hypothetical protein
MRIRYVKLRILSARWKVWLAEAVRRAVAQAEARTHDQKPKPVEMLRQLHDSGQSLDPEKAEAYLAQIYEDRKLLSSLSGTNPVIYGLIVGIFWRRRASLELSRFSPRCC